MVNLGLLTSMLTVTTLPWSITLHFFQFQKEEGAFNYNISFITNLLSIWLLSSNNA